MKTINTPFPLKNILNVSDSAQLLACVGYMALEHGLWLNDLLCSLQGLPAGR